MNAVATTLNFPVDYSLIMIKFNVLEGYMPPPAKKKPIITIYTFTEKAIMHTPVVDNVQENIRDIRLPK